MTVLDRVRSKAAMWDGTKKELFFSIFKDFSEYILSSEGIGEIQRQKLFYGLFMILFEFGLFEETENNMISMIKDKSRLDILYNGDTFKIVGCETELLELFSMLTENVLEKRIERRMKGIKESMLEIGLKISDADDIGLDEEFVSDIENVIAIQFIYWFPSEFDIDPVVIYPVIDFRKFDGGRDDAVDEIKYIGNGERKNMWVFTIRDDDGLKADIALSLDDPDVIFIEYKHLKR